MSEEPEKTEVSKAAVVTECKHENTKPVIASEVPRLVGLKNDVLECVECGVIISKPKETKKDK